MKDLLLWILKALIPPHDADPDHLYMYRMMVSAVLMINTAALTVHIALACGLISVFGFDGFATKQQVTEQVSHQGNILNDLIARQLDQQIMDIRTRQCTAERAGNSDALAFATDRLQAVLAEYQKVRGSYRLPGCDEVITAPVIVAPAATTH